MTGYVPSDDELRRAAETVTPGLEWWAHMDRYELIGQPPGSWFVNDQVKLALCATGEHAARLTSYLAKVQPGVVLSLLDRLAAADDAIKRCRGILLYPTADMLADSGHLNTTGCLAAADALLAITGELIKPPGQPPPVATASTS